MRLLTAFTMAMAAVATSAKVVDPDAFRTMEEIAADSGFATESYTLVTEDGYVLSLYRLPGTVQEIADGGIKQKPAVLMVHAQDCDMMEWVWNDSERANAFILARAGYDVWLANNRGNKYSNTHLTLSRHDKAYWDYYQEDMGLKDLPTFIDHILETTGLETISYVGHSEGTTQFLMGASLNPEYFTEKINLSVLLAPVGSTSNIPLGFLKEASKHLKLIEYVVVDVFNYPNMFAPMMEGQDAIVLFCGILPDVCKWAAHTFLHHDGVDNPDRFQMFMSNEPSGQSYRTFIYYGQMIRDGLYMRRYDYGRIKNQKVYGQADPPMVPLENYNVPTLLLSGELDKLSDPEDVAWLSQQLGDKVVFQKQYHNDHFTFAIGKDMSFFSVDAVEWLHKYNPVSKPENTDVFLQ